ncbi:MAG: hypothetical protein HY595_01315, partial [Candidatus Omnitrophica bacterium]|nr:hypothetical protein [Candidatus Omnitrophota bacterium]
ELESAKQRAVRLETQLAALRTQAAQASLLSQQISRRVAQIEASLPAKTTVKAPITPTTSSVSDTKEREQSGTQTNLPENGKMFVSPQETVTVHGSGGYWWESLAATGALMTTLAADLNTTAPATGAPPGGVSMSMSNLTIRRATGEEARALRDLRGAALSARGTHTNTLAWSLPAPSSTNLTVTGTNTAEKSGTQTNAPQESEMFVSPTAETRVDPRLRITIRSLTAWEETVAARLQRRALTPDEIEAISGVVRDDEQLLQVVSGPPAAIAQAREVLAKLKAHLPTPPAATPGTRLDGRQTNALLRQTADDLRGAVHDLEGAGEPMNRLDDVINRLEREEAQRRATQPTTSTGRLRAAAELLRDVERMAAARPRPTPQDAQAFREVLSNTELTLRTTRGAPSDFNDIRASMQRLNGYLNGEGLRAPPSPTAAGSAPPPPRLQTSDLTLSKADLVQLRLLLNDFRSRAAQLDHLPDQQARLNAVLDALEYRDDRHARRRIPTKADLERGELDEQIARLERIVKAVKEREQQSGAAADELERVQQDIQQGQMELKRREYEEQKGEVERAKNQQTAQQHLVDAMLRPTMYASFMPALQERYEGEQGVGGMLAAARQHGDHRSKSALTLMVTPEATATSFFDIGGASFGVLPSREEAQYALQVYRISMAIAEGTIESGAMAALPYGALAEAGTGLLAAPARNQMQEQGGQVWRPIPLLRSLPIVGDMIKAHRATDQPIVVKDGRGQFGARRAGLPFTVEMPKPMVLLADGVEALGALFGNKLKAGKENVWLPWRYGDRIPIIGNRAAAVFLEAVQRSPDSPYDYWIIRQGTSQLIAKYHRGTREWTVGSHNTLFFNKADEGYRRDMGLEMEDGKAIRIQSIHDLNRLAQRQHLAGEYGFEFDLITHELVGYTGHPGWAVEVTDVPAEDAHSARVIERDQNGVRWKSVSKPVPVNPFTGNIREYGLNTTKYQYWFKYRETYAGKQYYGWKITVNPTSGTRTIEPIFNRRDAQLLQSQLQVVRATKTEQGPIVDGIKMTIGDRDSSRDFLLPSGKTYIARTAVAGKESVGLTLNGAEVRLRPGARYVPEGEAITLVELTESPRGEVAPDVAAAIRGLSMTWFREAGKSIPGVERLTTDLEISFGNDRKFTIKAGTWVTWSAPYAAELSDGTKVPAIVEFAPTPQQAGRYADQVVATTTTGYGDRRQLASLPLVERWTASSLEPPEERRAQREAQRTVDAEIPGSYKSLAAGLNEWPEVEAYLAEHPPVDGLTPRLERQEQADAALKSAGQDLAEALQAYQDAELLSRLGTKTKKLFEGVRDLKRIAEDVRYVNGLKFVLEQQQAQFEQFKGDLNRLIASADQNTTAAKAAVDAARKDRDAVQRALDKAKTSERSANDALAKAQQAVTDLEADIATAVARQQTLEVRRDDLRKQLAQKPNDTTLSLRADQTVLEAEAAVLHVQALEKARERAQAGEADRRRELSQVGIPQHILDTEAELSFAQKRLDHLDGQAKLVNAQAKLFKDLDGDAKAIKSLEVTKAPIVALEKWEHAEQNVRTARLKAAELGETYAEKNADFERTTGQASVDHQLSMFQRGQAFADAQIKQLQRDVDLELKEAQKNLEAAYKVREAALLNPADPSSIENAKKDVLSAEFRVKRLEERWAKVSRFTAANWTTEERLKLVNDSVTDAHAGLDFWTNKVERVQEGFSNLSVAARNNPSDTYLVQLRDDARKFLQEAPQKKLRADAYLKETKDLQSKTQDERGLNQARIAQLRAQVRANPLDVEAQRELRLLESNPVTAVAVAEDDLADHKDHLRKIRAKVGSAKVHQMRLGQLLDPARAKPHTDFRSRLIRTTADNLNVLEGRGWGPLPSAIKGLANINELGMDIGRLRETRAQRRAAVEQTQARFQTAAKQVVEAHRDMARVRESITTAMPQAIASSGLSPEEAQTARRQLNGVLSPANAPSPQIAAAAGTASGEVFFANLERSLDLIADGTLPLVDFSTVLESSRGAQGTQMSVFDAAEWFGQKVDVHIVASQAMKGAPTAQTFSLGLRQKDLKHLIDIGWVRRDQVLERLGKNGVEFDKVDDNRLWLFDAGGVDALKGKDGKKRFHMRYAGFVDVDATHSGDLTYAQHVLMKYDVSRAFSLYGEEGTADSRFEREAGIVVDGEVDPVKMINRQFKLRSQELRARGGFKIGDPNNQERKLTIFPLGYERTEDALGRFNRSQPRPGFSVQTPWKLGSTPGRAEGEMTIGKGGLAGEATVSTTIAKRFDLEVGGVYYQDGARGGDILVGIPVGHDHKLKVGVGSFEPQQGRGISNVILGAETGSGWGLGVTTDASRPGTPGAGLSIPEQYLPKVLRNDKRLPRDEQGQVISVKLGEGVLPTLPERKTVDEPTVKSGTQTNARQQGKMFVSPILVPVIPAALRTFDGSTARLSEQEWTAHRDQVWRADVVISRLTEEQYQALKVARQADGTYRIGQATFAGSDHLLVEDDLPIAVVKLPQQVLYTTKTSRSSLKAEQGLGARLLLAGGEMKSLTGDQWDSMRRLESLRWEELQDLKDVVKSWVTPDGTRHFALKVREGVVTAKGVQERTYWHELPAGSERTMILREDDGSLSLVVLGEQGLRRAIADDLKFQDAYAVLRIPGKKPMVFGGGERYSQENFDQDLEKVLKWLNDSLPRDEQGRKAEMELQPRYVRRDPETGAVSLIPGPEATIEEITEQEGAEVWVVVNKKDDSLYGIFEFGKSALAEKQQELERLQQQRADFEREFERQRSSAPPEPPGSAGTPPPLAPVRPQPDTSRDADQTPQADASPVKRMAAEAIEQGRVAIATAPKGHGLIYAHRDRTGKLTYLPPGLSVAVQDAGDVNPGEAYRDNPTDYRRLYRVLFDNDFALAKRLDAAGVNSIKLYLPANNPSPTDLAKLKQDIATLYAKTGLRTSLLSFGGLYAENGRGNYVYANPTPENLRKVENDITTLATQLKDLGPALAGIQIGNENAYYVPAAYDSIQLGGDQPWNTVNLSPSDYYRLMARLARAYKAVDPTHPVFFGHGEIEAPQVDQMRQAGIGRAFDGLALNLYPGGPHGAELVHDDVPVYVEGFGRSIRRAQSLGLPVIVSEFGKSSTGIGEDRQAAYVDKAAQALRRFMWSTTKAPANQPQIVVGIDYHELLPEPWKDRQIDPAESGLALIERRDGAFRFKPAFDRLTRHYTQTRDAFTQEMRRLSERASDGDVAKVESNDRLLRQAADQPIAFSDELVRPQHPDLMRTPLTPIGGQAQPSQVAPAQPTARLDGFTITERLGYEHGTDLKLRRINPATGASYVEVFRGKGLLRRDQFDPQLNRQVSLHFDHTKSYEHPKAKTEVDAALDDLTKRLETYDVTPQRDAQGKVVRVTVAGTNVLTGQALPTSTYDASGRLLEQINGPWRTVITYREDQPHLRAETRWYYGRATGDAWRVRYTYDRDNPSIATVETQDGRIQLVGYRIEPDPSNPLKGKTLDERLFFVGKVPIMAADGRTVERVEKKIVIPLPAQGKIGVVENDLAALAQAAAAGYEGVTTLERSFFRQVDLEEPFEGVPARLVEMGIGDQRTIMLVSRRAGDAEPDSAFQGRTLLHIFKGTLNGEPAYTAVRPPGRGDRTISTNLVHRLDVAAFERPNPEIRILGSVFQERVIGTPNESTALVKRDRLDPRPGKPVVADRTEADTAPWEVRVNGQPFASVFARPLGKAWTEVDQVWRYYFQVSNRLQDHLGSTTPVSDSYTLDLESGRPVAVTRATVSADGRAVWNVASGVGFDQPLAERLQVDDLTATVTHQAYTSDFSDVVDFSLPNPSLDNRFRVSVGQRILPWSERAPDGPTMEPLTLQEAAASINGQPSVADLYLAVVNRLDVPADAERTNTNVLRSELNRMANDLAQQPAISTSRDARTGDPDAKIGAHVETVPAADLIGELIEARRFDEAGQFLQFYRGAMAASGHPVALLHRTHDLRGIGVEYTHPLIQARPVGSPSSSEAHLAVAEQALALADVLPAGAMQRKRDALDMALTLLDGALGFAPDEAHVIAGRFPVGQLEQLRLRWWYYVDEFPTAAQARAYRLLQAVEAVLKEADGDDQATRRWKAAWSKKLAPAFATWPGRIEAWFAKFIVPRFLQEQEGLAKDRHVVVRGAEEWFRPSGRGPKEIIEVAAVVTSANDWLWGLEAMRAMLKGQPLRKFTVELEGGAQQTYTVTQEDLRESLKALATVHGIRREGRWGLSKNPVYMNTERMRGPDDRETVRLRDPSIDRAATRHYWRLREAFERRLQGAEAAPAPSSPSPRGAATDPDAVSPAGGSLVEWDTLWTGDLTPAWWTAMRTGWSRLDSPTRWLMGGAVGWLALLTIATVWLSRWAWRRYQRLRQAALATTALWNDQLEQAAMERWKKLIVTTELNNLLRGDSPVVPIEGGTMMSLHTLYTTVMEWRRRELRWSPNDPRLLDDTDAWLNGLDEFVLRVSTYMGQVMKAEKQDSPTTEDSNF